jgi:hypothetical protein
MKQKSGPDKAPAEQVLKNIRRQTRRQYSAEEKIRIIWRDYAAKRASRSFARRLDVLRLVRGPLPGLNEEIGQLLPVDRPRGGPVFSRYCQLSSP